ncbi:metalloreductase transmembrane component [Aspergillus nomiae NRRL 13137]|uniref:ferric-chelate reductase (NADPH) n=1 Tax=Aspergillus nomiae NRRL (strain ATCC 15546 / NRRL 13137 / CBS 260.88 / M93) TaxID=1509407 RepID=A0A0L1IQL1_ASPN3|nr:metalloreductase transmembrane component [Aspergillus nomiae NRRL 13137]KNG81881.1 metalloreductase transmembrane component [Aspergillus nomiae NRRL 13137]
MLPGWHSIASLVKRIDIPIVASTTPAEIAEMQRDAWPQAGKYGLGWVYFSVILLAFSTIIRFYHLWGDKIRIALHKEDTAGESPYVTSPQEEYELSSAATDSSTAHFFPARGPLPSTNTTKQQSSISTVAPLNNTIAFVRWVFYRPIPVLRIGKLRIGFPSLGASSIIFAALIFVTLYCFVPQPLYYSSISIGSPPLAIRAGMIAVAMIPWIILLSTRANFISFLTGISHERLNVLHRWAGYLCLFLSLIHMVPFYVTPIWESKNLMYYQQYFPRNIYIYGTGWAALAPLIVLCLHSMPILRARMYELFKLAHLPLSVVFLAMIFWHSKNFLASWDYLWATVAIWILSYGVRLFYVNWSNPLRLSFLIGEECAVTILPQNAIKVTVATQMKWKPGQFVYLRMPGISLFERHPFTISSLCSGDFPSEYGENYRDLALVFRPFGGFTRNVFLKTFEYGPYKTWTAFLEGPYGGMKRDMAAFDDVVFFAGGSGITATASHLLDLIKKMRDRKAVTKSVRVIWAFRNPETIDWFREELRICRDFAPPNTVHCHFFLTGLGPNGQEQLAQNQFYEEMLRDKMYNTLEGMDKRNSAYIREEAAGDPEIEKELRRENEDAITALPQAHTLPHINTSRHYNSPSMDNNYQQAPYYSPQKSPADTPFHFGFPPSSTAFPKLTTRVGTVPLQRNGWRIDYARPNIPQVLKDYSRTFGRRTCVFVCGPPSMRVEVSNAVAQLQQQVITDASKDEIFLHAENYNV